MKSCLNIYAGLVLRKYIYKIFVHGFAGLSTKRREKRWPMADMRLNLSNQMPSEATYGPS